MLNKTALLLGCSLLVVGCNCNNPSGKKEAQTVYDVKCYAGGTLIMDTTTSNKPTVTTGNTYWKDDATGALVDIAASCVVVPRKSDQPKTSLVNSGQIINEL